MTPDDHTNQELFLDVGDGHQLYVHDWGNPKAKMPILFLHGGPGAGCNDGHKQSFDPAQQRVIFHDQRGSGKSLPAGSLEHNTTHDAANDINKVTERLGIKQFILTGGSWGSLLALVYAIHNPERLHAMVLRGIFTGTTAEEHWLTKGGFKASFPEVWEAYLQNTPTAHHADPSAYHLKQIAEGTPEEQKRSAYAYGNMEYALLSLDDRPKVSSYEDYDPTSIMIETHYAAHKYWLEERFVLDNAHKLTMPVFLVHGRYDMLCPPLGAYQLHQNLPHSQLIWTVAGHSGGDRANYDTARALLLQLCQTPA